MECNCDKKLTDSALEKLIKKVVKEVLNDLDVLDGIKELKADFIQLLKRYEAHAHKNGETSRPIDREPF
jgi:hypothetical protein